MGGAADVMSWSTVGVPTVDPYSSVQDVFAPVAMAKPDCAWAVMVRLEAVSYTHLDGYKRQPKLDRAFDVVVPRIPCPSHQSAAGGQPVSYIYSIAGPRCRQEAPHHRSEQSVSAAPAQASNRVRHRWPFFTRPYPFHIARPLRTPAHPSRPPRTRPRPPPAWRIAPSPRPVIRREPIKPVHGLCLLYTSRCV